MICQNCRRRRAGKHRHEIPTSAGTWGPYLPVCDRCYSELDATFMRNIRGLTSIDRAVKASQAARAA